MTAENDVKADELWRKYLMLTQEMNKFLDKDDADTFLALLEQRQTLQGMITQLGNTSYHLTAEGRQVISQINPLSEIVQRKVQLWLNRGRQRKQMTNAYDSLGMSIEGQILNHRL